MNGVKLIDNLHQDPNSIAGNSSINLTAGQSYPIRLVMRHDSGDARAELKWQRPGSGMTVMPAAQFNNCVGAQKLGLAAHYKLDETSGSVAVDSVSDINGTLVTPVSDKKFGTAGGATASVSVKGVANQAVNFSEDGAKISITNNFGASPNISVALWAKINSFDPSNEAQLLNIGNSISLSLTPTQLKWTFKHSGGDHTQSIAFEHNELWHHYALSFDDTNDMQHLFIDGQLVQEIKAPMTSATDSISYIGTNSAIGGHPSNADYDVRGDIDDVRIFNRAITRTEVQDLAGPNLISGTARCGIDNQFELTFDGPLSSWYGNDSYVGLYTLKDLSESPPVVKTLNTAQRLSANSLLVTASNNLIAGHTYEISAMGRATTFTMPTNDGYGLSGTYFNQMGNTANEYWKGTKLPRIDTSIDLNNTSGYGSAAPIGTGEQHFTSRWDGVFKPDTSGLFELNAQLTGKARIWVNGQLVLDQWAASVSGNFISSAFQLKAGQDATVHVEFAAKELNYDFELSWRQSTSSSFKPIAREHMATCRGEFPALSHGFAYCEVNNQLVLDFKQSIEPTSATDISNYTLIADGIGQVAVNDALLISSHEVLLKTDPFNLGSKVNVTTTNVSEDSLDIYVPNAQQPGLVANFFDQNTGTAAGKLKWNTGGLFSGNRELIPNGDFKAVSGNVDNAGNLDYDWANGSPVVNSESMGSDDFSVIWNGFITPTKVDASKPDTYYFRTTSSDGSRVYINSDLVVDNWGTHSTQQATSNPVTLTENEPYPIRVEYFEATGQASIKLEWKRPGGTWEVIKGSDDPGYDPNIANSGNPAALNTCVAKPEFGDFPMQLNQAAAVCGSDYEIHLHFSSEVPQLLLTTADATTFAVTQNGINNTVVSMEHLDPSQQNIVVLKTQDPLVAGALHEVTALGQTINFFNPAKDGRGLQQLFWDQIESGSKVPGAYFTGATQSRIWQPRLFKTIDESIPGIGADDFSARFSGVFKAPKAYDGYKFRVTVNEDQGFRFWAGGILWLDNWESPTSMDSGPVVYEFDATDKISLTQGQQLPVRMDLWEGKEDTEFKVEVYMPTGGGSYGWRPLSSQYLQTCQGSLNQVETLTPFCDAPNKVLLTFRDPIVTDSEKSEATNLSRYIVNGGAFAPTLAATTSHSRQVELTLDTALNAQATHTIEAFGQSLEMAMPPASAQGLYATYFNQKSAGAIYPWWHPLGGFKGYSTSEVDSIMHHHWGADPIIDSAAFDNNQMTARWNGLVYIPTTGEHQFRIQAHAGVRLWVDGILLSEEWQTEPTERWIETEVVTLSENTMVPVRIDYIAYPGDNMMKFEWKQPDINNLPNMTGWKPFTQPDMRTCLGSTGTALDGVEVDHFTVEYGDGDRFGITCAAPKTIRIKAMDKDNVEIPNFIGKVFLDTGTGIGTWAGGQGTLENNNGDGKATYTFGLLDNGVAELTLDYTEGSNNDHFVDVTVKHADDFSITDDQSHDDLIFSPRGFTITGAPYNGTTKTPAGTPNEGDGYHIKAGTEIDIYVTAYGIDPNNENAEESCDIIETYDGTQTVEVHMYKSMPNNNTPGVGNVAPNFDGNAISTNSGAPTNLSLNFSNGKAGPYKFSYKDVGRVNLIFSDKDFETEDNTTNITGSTTLTSIPDKLVVEVDGYTPEDPVPGSSADYSVFGVAGTAFTVNVKALSVDPDGAGPLTGDLLPSFGLEGGGTPDNHETVRLKTTDLGFGGSVQGVLNEVTPFSLSDGVYTGTFKYSEVGTIELVAELVDDDTPADGYMKVGVTQSADIVGKIENASGVATQLGRFTPHSFDVTTNSPTFAYPNNGGTGSCNFGYYDQDIEYATSPTITITAKNADGVITQNYQGSFATMPTSLTASHSGSQALTGTSIQGSFTVSSDFAAGTPGQAEYTLSGAQIGYAKGASPLAPANFSINLSTSTALTDSDGLSAGTPTFATINNPTIEIRHGRITLDHASGAELYPLEMVVNSEYFDGTGFVINEDDNDCQPNFTVTHDLTNPNISPKALTASPLNFGYTTSVTTFTNGKAIITLHDEADSTKGPVDTTVTPNVFQSGQVLMKLDLSATPHLQYDFRGNGPEDPQGIASFGAYRGIDMFIHIKENYR